MLSQDFNRSTAIRRNSFGYRPTRRFATCSSFPCKVCLFRVSHFRGSVHRRSGFPDPARPPCRPSSHLGATRKGLLNAFLSFVVTRFAAIGTVVLTVLAKPNAVIGLTEAAITRAGASRFGPVTHDTAKFLLGGHPNSQSCIPSRNAT